MCVTKQLNKGDMELGQDKDTRYFNADKYTEEQVENLFDRALIRWWIVVIGDDDIPDESELDVWARDKKEAREVARVALERDFDPGIKVTKVMMA